MSDTLFLSVPRHSDISFNIWLLSFLFYFYFFLLLFLYNMVKTTLIARVADGLPLAASMDDEQVN